MKYGPPALTCHIETGPDFNDTIKLHFTHGANSWANTRDHIDWIYRAQIFGFVYTGPRSGDTGFFLGPAALMRTGHCRVEDFYPMTSRGTVSRRPRVPAKFCMSLQTWTPQTHDKPLGWNPTTLAAYEAWTRRDL